MQALMNRIDTLLAEWHEAGRADYEEHLKGVEQALGFRRWYVDPTTAYNDQEAKRCVVRRKYIALDSGPSGVWLIDKTDGMVYDIKVYGVPNKKKCLGHIDTITGADLHRLRR